MQALALRLPTGEGFGAFTDGVKLLRVAERMKLEGVVSKRRGTAYRSGGSADLAEREKTNAWRGQP